jgi:hypothetical protein
LCFMDFGKKEKLRKGRVVVKVWCKVGISCFVYC